MNGLDRSVGAVATVLVLVVGCASSDTPSAETPANSAPTTTLAITAADLAITPPATTVVAASSVALAGEASQENGCPPVGVIADIAEAIGEAVRASRVVAEDHARDAALLIEAWETFNPYSQESLDMLESTAPDPDANNQSLLAESEASIAYVSAVASAAAESYGALDEGNRRANEILAAVANDEVGSLGELDSSVVRALVVYEAAVASAEAAGIRHADAQSAHNRAIEEYEAALAEWSEVDLVAQAEEAYAAGKTPEETVDDFARHLQAMEPWDKAERAALIDSLRAGISASDAREAELQAFFALYEEVLWATLNDRCN